MKLPSLVECRLLGRTPRWRHDQVLRVIAESIEKLRRGKAEGKPSKNIVFVKEGTSLPRSQSKGQKNLISAVDDWKLDVDLNKKQGNSYYKFKTRQCYHLRKPKQ